ncbi:hypothetical protein ACFWOG_36025 [Kitasatospora sp. NPDC058406]|uniref:hypothetical protein n=1 Tax=Kitasatospora sp. NPDC058406 TaxID=3346483 RepID=UPI003663E2F6
MVIPIPVNRLPLTATTDPRNGGRWTSLRGGGREWLWHRHCPARDTVRPGDAFVDAGGLEECLPTVRGTPDHGDAWSRPWRRDGDTDVLDHPDFVLRRSLRQDRTGALCASYRLSADPGYRFLWAAHALLDVGPGARLVAPAGTAARVFPEAAPLIDRPWPANAPHLTGRWPTPLGLPLDRLGPEDGTAVGAVLTDCADVSVVDGRDTLRLSLRADADVPVSVALWRNLGGYPATGPYRSIGVEPMLGAVFDLAEAGRGDAAVVPAAGDLRWELTLTAGRTPSPSCEGTP